MKILHYTLGFSPYRSGGLVKYAQDLMLEEINLGHHISKFVIEEKQTKK